MSAGENKSFAEMLAELPDDERDAVLSTYTEADFAAMKYEADFWLRPNQKIPDGDWYITALIAGRGFGKLLCTDVNLPTPSGWKRMGDIQDGDKIFDEQGRECTVTKAHPIQYPKKAYRLTFSDGTDIVAGEEHLWTTWTHRDRKSFNRRNDYIPADQSTGLPENWPQWTKENKNGTTDLDPIGPKTRTTQEIVDTFRYGKRGDLNHSIPVAMPLQYSAKNLPIDPYLYGMYIGDGTTSSGDITSHNDECAWLVGQFLSAGYIATIAPEKNKNCSTVKSKKFREDMRAAKLVGHKNIPDIYLQSSIEQRKAFLAGQLDSDGYIDPVSSYVEFCTVTPHHAESMMELARSLGQKPRMYVGDATIYGVSHGPKYRVCWRPTFNPFRMPRKMAGFRPLAGQASRTMHRMITSFEEVPIRPMRCLTVDSPNHLFLAGEAMVPTHNTFAMSQWVRRKAMENPGCRIAIGGRTVGDVRRIMVLGESGILAVHPEADRPTYKPSTATLHWPNGSSAELHSSESPDAARGVQYHYSANDEFASWKNDVDSSGATLYSNLIAATRLGSHPQILLGTTPKRTAVMKDIMDRAKDPDQKITIIRGSTFENSALSSTYIENLKRQYGNSDLAKQELEGMMLEDAEGLVFTQSMIDKMSDVSGGIPNLPLKFIAVDPSVSGDPATSDECGIMAVGSTVERDLTQRRAYVLEDYSIRATPDVWAERVVDAAREHRTKFVVIEKNQGGDLLRMVLTTKDPTLKVMTVTAKKGKQIRAEPVIVAVQQGRVKLASYFPTLLDQLLFFDPSNSRNPDDRFDAFIWGVTASLVEPPDGLKIYHSRVSSGAGRKLPQGRGTGRTRHTSSLHNPRRSGSGRRFG